MKEKLTLADLKPLILKMSDDISKHREKIGDLDSQTGDGDLGVTAVMSFRAMVKATEKCAGQSISGILKEFSYQVGEDAPSTFGTFISTMLSGMSDELSNVIEFGAVEYARALKAAGEAVMKRGGAKPGDKTLLDVIIPSAEVAMKACEAGKKLPECADAVASEAILCAERTVQMEAKTGRAGYMGARTIGFEDAGAEAVALMLVSFKNYIHEN